MGLPISLSLFFMVAVGYSVIIDIFVILFRTTGLTEDVARFQVASLLTNSGYSTQESELVTGVSIRRKLARRVMLFGYIFGVTVVSVFVSVVISLPEYKRQEEWPVLLCVAVAFVLFLVVKRLPKVRQFFDARMEKWARKRIYGKKQNAVVYIGEFARGSLARVRLDVVPDELLGMTQTQADLPRRYGVRIVFLERDGEPVDGEATLKEGDVIAVFGKREQIDKVFGIEKK